MNTFQRLKTFQILSLIALLLLTGSCAKSKQQKSPCSPCGRSAAAVDTGPDDAGGPGGDFATYFERFEQRARENGQEIETNQIGIKFANNFGDRVMAVCIQRAGLPSEIEVNKSYWDKFGDTKREMLIFHELGHCSLDRRHRSEVDSRGRPMSLMYDTMFSVTTYSDLHADYMRELFLANAASTTTGDMIHIFHDSENR